MTLTCRPLSLLLTKRLNSSLLITAGPWDVIALSINFSQTFFPASLLKSSYLNITWILLSMASSNSVTRFVVRNRIPL